MPPASERLFRRFAPPPPTGGSFYNHRDHATHQKAQVAAAIMPSRMTRAIAIDISGLQPRRDLVADADGECRAVGAERSMVPSSPASTVQMAEPDRRADRNQVVDFVEIPFVHQEAVQMREHGDKGRRRLRPGNVIAVSDRQPDEHDDGRDELDPQRHFMGGVDEMRIVNQAAGPECGTFLGPEEGIIEEEAREDRAQR